MQKSRNFRLQQDVARNIQLIIFFALLLFTVALLIYGGQVIKTGSNTSNDIGEPITIENTNEKD